MRLTTAEIDRYGPLSGWSPPCEEGIAVLSGPNEAGKTLYLEAVLQLLEPDIANQMRPPPRVTQAPTGRVVVEYAGEQYECDGGTTLSDISAIDPSHLQSIFVVQDNDLQLPSEQEYYTSLIEKLGEIHTTEINAIESALKDHGRLTDARLNISDDRDYDKAASVHDDAESLAEEIREYTTQIEEEGLDQLDAERLRVKRQLQTTRQELEAMQAARVAHEHAQLSESLATYRSKREKLDEELADFDRETLRELRDLKRELERNREDLEDTEKQIAEKQEERDETEEKLAELEERKAALERREAAVDEAADALDSYRGRQGEAAGAERRLTLTRYATPVGIIAAAGAGIVGAVTGSLPTVLLGVVIFLAAIASGIDYYRSTRQVTSVETTRERALQAARDAGLEVTTVEDVAPAIESYRNKLSKATTRVVRTEESLENLGDSLEQLRDQQSKLESEIADQEEQVLEILKAAGVETIDEFESNVERREEIEPELRSAKQRLEDEFGSPDADTPEDKATAWEAALDELVADINLDEVDPSEFDGTVLEDLEENVEAFESKLAELEDRLEEHDAELDEFDRRATGLRTEPFIGQPVSLESRSKDGLNLLANDLEGVVEQLEEDAERSRNALEIFERIEEQEEQKLTGLFASDGAASATFERLTDGRYTQVAYDPEAHDLTVERHDGRTLSPDVLSQGTKDQLYFASRISLAKQLLGNEPGFLLLDDPLLAADPERLHQGFETLQALGDEGWQILYFTAKQEVSDEMVSEYDLNHVEMDPISL